MAVNKLTKVTKANVGPRNNVGGALNNALVTVQDHNKVIDAVNLLYDNQAAGAMIVVEVKAATTDDIVILISDVENIASRFDLAAAAAGTSDIIPAVGELIIIMRAV